MDMLILLPLIFALVVGLVFLTVRNRLLGLVLSPIAALIAGVGLAMATALGTDALFTVILVCTFFVVELAVLVAAAMGGAPPGAQSVLTTVAQAAGIVSMAAVALVLCLTSGPFGLAMTLAIFVLVIRYVVISRDARTTHVFSVLTAAMRQNLPLATALDADAAGAKGKLRAILSRISGHLTEGLSLSETLRKGFSQCPGFALAEVTAAEKVHQLPQALARIQERMARLGSESLRLRPMNPFYLFIVIAFASLLLDLVGLFVYPSFQKILLDMDVPMPAMTQWVFDELMTPLNFVFPIMLLVAAFWLYAVLRPRRAWEPRLLSRVGDVCKWHWPVTAWFERKSSILQAISLLRMELSAAVPLDQAIAAACELDVNVCYRRRLRNWLTRVQAGEGVSQAARASGVGSGLEWAFDESANPGGAPQVLEMLESSYKAAYDYRGNLLRFILYPLAVLAMAMLVATIVIALFLPMVAIIQSVVSAVV